MKKVRCAFGLSELYSIERLFRPQSRENLRRARKFTEVVKTGCLKFENQNAIQEEAAKRENSRGQHKVLLTYSTQDWCYTSVWRSYLRLERETQKRIKLAPHDAFTVIGVGLVLPGMLENRIGYTEWKCLSRGEWLVPTWALFQSHLTNFKPGMKEWYYFQEIQICPRTKIKILKCKICTT